MSANPKPFDIVGEIFKEHFTEDPMLPLKNLYAQVKAHAVEEKRNSRDLRKQFIESELVEYRPDFMEATEILSALKTGLALRVGPYGDDLPIEVEHAFQDLHRAMDAACPYEPEAYDSMSDYGEDHPYEPK